MRQRFGQNFIGTCVLAWQAALLLVPSDALVSTRRETSIHIWSRVGSPRMPNATPGAQDSFNGRRLSLEKYAASEYVSLLRPPRLLHPSGLSMSPGTNEESSEEEQVQVYPQRWVQLGFLSALALLSDWICFSVAAAPSTYETAFGHSASQLIDIFLFTNVASCFLVTDVVNKVGLQKAIQGAAALMALGCWLRSGVSFLMPVANAVESLLLASTSNTNDVLQLSSPELVPYPVLVLGTLCVGAAQPFFQCTPPLLSAQWFAASERATSTAVALNFNQIGIATAFLVGGAMATSTSGLISYFGLISVLSTIVLGGALLQFENLPPTPPSVSELEKLESGESEPPFLDSVKTFFANKGFTRPLAAFICSISLTNVVGAFIDELMHRGGVSEQFTIDLAGAGFELAILLGGIIIGGLVDRTKEYKNVTLACLAATIVMLLPLGLTDHALGNEPILLVAALLGLGMAAGPVQPINAELAVDVTYPGDETAVESVQQIGGNLFSALLVPVAEIALSQDFQLFPGNPKLASDVRGDVVLLMAITALTYLFFSGFDAPLKRSMADSHSIGKREDSQMISKHELVSREALSEEISSESLEEVP